MWIGRGHVFVVSPGIPGVFDPIGPTSAFRIRPAELSESSTELASQVAGDPSFPTSPLPG